MLLVLIGEEFQVLHLMLRINTSMYKLSMGKNILRKPLAGMLT